MNVDKLIEELELRKRAFASAAKRMLANGEPTSAANWETQRATMAYAIDIVKRHAEEKSHDNNRE